jgi:site-specific recombinase XerC
VPVFTSGELSKLERACQGRGFAQRRDAAIIAVFKATGIRAAELAGIRYDAHDPQASDLNLWQREITVRGKGGKVRVVKITHDGALALDRYIRVRPGMPRRGGASCGSEPATAGDPLGRRWVSSPASPPPGGLSWRRCPPPRCGSWSGWMRPSCAG